MTAGRTKDNRSVKRMARQLPCIITLRTQTMFGTAELALRCVKRTRKIG